MVRAGQINKPGSLDRLRAIMATLRLLPVDVERDVADVNTSATLTEKIETAKGKAAELFPQTQTADKLVKDLAKQLDDAQTKANAVGAQHWIALSTAGDRSLDLRRLREGNPRIFADSK
jgi:hypothetical protein